MSLHFPHVDYVHTLFVLHAHAAMVCMFGCIGGPIATNWSMVNGTVVHESVYSEAEDDEQTLIMQEWASPMWQEITADEKGDLTVGGLNIVFVEYTNYEVDMFGELDTAQAFFGLAVIVVLMYMSFHLHSCFLGCGAMLQILLSFVLAFFVYRVVLGIEYTDYFTMMVIFILLGIGAV